MNRRNFLTRVSVGTVGLIAAANLPTTWFPAPIRRQAATDFLLKAWNAHTKGHPERMGYDIYASEDLFDAFSAEILSMQRFTSSDLSDPTPTPTLVFKQSRLKRWESKHPGWHLMFHMGTVHANS